MRKMTNLMISDANRKSSMKVERLTINHGGECCKIIKMNKTQLNKLNRQYLQVSVAMGDNEEYLCFMLILDNFVQK